MRSATLATPQLLDRDLKTLAIFVQIYCQYRHAQASQSPFSIPTHDVAAITGRPIELCPECKKLLAHAFTKRSHCPMNPKPMCKHCPSHCYHQAYRAKMREVMRFSGRTMLLRGRLDYLLHLLF